MDPLSNVNRLSLVLRERLLERLKAQRGSGPAKSADARTGPASSEGVRAIAGLENLDERQLRRAIIEHVLAEQFGTELLNEPSFQQIVDKVTEAVDTDPDGAQLLDRTLAEFRQSNP